MKIRMFSEGSLAPLKSAMARATPRRGPKLRFQLVQRGRETSGIGREHGLEGALTSQVPWTKVLRGTIV